MPAALEYVSPGNWETMQTNFDTISSNLRQPMPQARVFNSGNLSINDATETSLTFNSERYDNGDLHSTSANTGRLTAPITGLYSFGTSIEFASNATGDRGVTFRINGTTYVSYTMLRAATGIVSRITVPGEYQLVAGDYVEVRVYQSSGGALNVLANGNYSPEFWMHRVGGHTNEGIAV